MPYIQQEFILRDRAIFINSNDFFSSIAFVNITICEHCDLVLFSHGCQVPLLIDPIFLEMESSCC